MLPGRLLDSAGVARRALLGGHTRSDASAVEYSGRRQDERAALGHLTLGNSVPGAGRQWGEEERRG